MNTVTIKNIIQILTERSIGVEYQPIICLQTNEVMAYEALARFKINTTVYPPHQVFEAAHSHFELFFLLEAAAKEIQLSNRPKDHQLYINMDPHLLHDENALNYWQNFLNSHEQVTVEIIENLHGCDMESISRFIELIAPSGCKTALDDFGQENAIYFSSLLEKVDVLKFDRNVFLKAHSHIGYRHLLRGFIDFAHANGQKTVIEGVETQHDYDLAKELGSDYTQGFFFKERFLSAFA